MLIFGTAELLPELAKEKFIILNFSSLVTGLEQLHLIPNLKDIPVNIQDEYNFNMAYWNWVLSNDEQFIDLMKIVYPLYCGYNVFVVVNWYDSSGFTFLASMNETLMKLIQERYGYSASIINTIEDYKYQHNSELESEFSPQGILNMDNDKSILSYKLESIVMNGGEPIQVVGFKYAESGDYYV